jgi:hypothetical protein
LEGGTDGKVGGEKFDVVAHQKEMAVEVEGEHLVVGLIGGPMVFGYAVGGNDYAGAIVAKVAVDEDFFPRVVAQELEKRSDLIVGGAEKCAGGYADVAHAGRLNRFLLRVSFASVAEIHNDGNAEILQLAIADSARLGAAIQELTLPALRIPGMESFSAAAGRK